MDSYKIKYPNIVTEIIKKELKKHILDDEVTIYRGFNSRSREDGTSFTLSKSVAEFFSNRLSNFNSRVGYVCEYKVKVEDILAYIPSEKEVITENAIFIKRL